MCKKMGIVKRLLSLLIAFVLILSLSANKVQAISVPMLPYIPPSDVVQMDLLFNIFGITKPAIQDDVKRLQGYWSLIDMVMGASAEATKNKIEQMFEDARTSRAWEIDPETISALNQIGARAIIDGVQEGYTPAIADLSMVHSMLVQQGIQIGQDTLTTMYNYARNQLGYDLSLCYIWCYQGGMESILFGWHDKTKKAIFKNSVPYKWQVSGDTWITQYEISSNGVLGSRLTNSRYAIEMSAYWQGLRKAYDFGEKSTNATVTAQNSQVADALAQGKVIPITATTTIVNGAIDDTKPARIHLPTSLPIPAETVADLPAVQEQLGVVPISDDVTETVAQLQQAVMESVGSASDYAIDLTQYFPFCLPFDIFRIIGVFIAEPEAPKFSYVIVNPFVNDGEHNIELEIDLSIFDQVAEVLRTLESILFVVGLCVVTRSLYLRG